MPYRKQSSRSYGSHKPVNVAVVQASRSRRTRESIPQEDEYRNVLAGIDKAKQDSKIHIKSEDTKDPTGKTRTSIELKYRGQNVGHASVTYFENKTDYPAIGVTIPAKTAAYGETTIAKDFRGKGYGTQMLNLAEEEAQKRGMKRMRVGNVDNAHFFAARGYYYTGIQRIFEKDLTGKAPSEIDKKRTETYLNLFPAYYKED